MTENEILNRKMSPKERAVWRYIFGRDDTEDKRVVETISLRACLKNLKVLSKKQVESIIKEFYQ